MSEAVVSEAGGGPRLRLADGLALAASPTFAVMALATGLLSGPDTLLCAAAPPSALHGMAAMYLLMSVFHAAPWLRRWRGGEA